MFDKCDNAGPKCTEVAEKIVQLFGWRQTYNVEKLQRNVPDRATTRISITRPSVRCKLKEGPDSWVSVHNLQTQGGGILDPDDRLNDVADDREQIVASFEDGDGAHHHAGGDGASGSSVGTGSPDLFNDGDHKYAPPYHRTDIEVTGEQIASGLSGALQVRRGSEPALNQLPVGPPVPSDHNKRWSAAPLIVEPPSSTTSYLRPLWNEETKEEEEELGFRRVGRDGSNRLSMQFLGDGAGYRWAEAAERAAQSRATTSLPRESKRKEPLGQANITTSPLPSIEDINSSGELIIIRNEPGPLGIHVVPDYDRLGKDRGLLVQGIEPGGRIDRDGRLAVFDRIIEINGQNLLNMPFQRVQEMFKLSLTSPELRLRVIKSSGMDGSRKPPPPVYPRFPEDKENVSMVECEQKQSTNTKVATVSPTKKLPAPSRNLKSLLSANTRKIGKKIELELTKGPHGLGFSITTRDNPAGGNCPIYIKNIIPKGAAVEDGRLKIGDRLLEVNGVEMTGKSQSEAVAVLRNAPSGSKVKIVVSRQEDVIDNSQPTNNTNSLPRIIGGASESYEKEENEPGEVTKASDTPPNIPPLPQSHLQMQRTRTPEKSSSVAKIISQFQEATSPPSKVDDMIFPWKHREILTFNIPVHDSEKAGLGISVKGKTSDSQDLGIFIKSVINGGAASRDKRLRTNDQLLNVNGISLLQQSNSDAMETLRKAMLHTEGLIPGNITLTIARRVASPDSTRRSQSRSDPNLLCSTGDNSNETEPSGNENSGTSSSSTNTVIFNPHESSKPCPPQSLSPMHTWNPVLQRLTGCNKQALRNESYYKAAHESWSASTLGNNSYGSNCTTTNINTEEPILIEDEYGSRIVPQNPKSKSPLIVKTLSNGSLENRNDHEPDGKASLTGSNCDKNTDTSSQTTVITGADATYASQLSLENPAGFSRDAFGRQSMSEKRHATLDAKNTDTYQRSKKLREERDKHRETNLVRVGSVESIISVNRATEHPEYADKLGQLGPSLGMKKSSSLESLQTMVQEIQMQEEGDPAYSYRTTAGGLKVIRGRGCEESFRAAVVDKHLVDPNHRSEITAKKHWLLDPPTDHEREIDGFTSVRGGPRQSSLNAALDRKHKSAKKKQGIFKGIGSMFRFGKHRKIDFNTAAATEQQYANANELESENYVLRTRQGHRDGDGNIGGQLEDGGGAGGEGHANERVQQEREREREQMYQKHGFVHRHAEQVQVIPENAVAPPVKYRSNISGEHIQRRSDRSNQNKNHNQRLLHRHSHYPSDETPYEHITRKRIEQTINAYGSDFGRPGSRSGISEHPPFTHYVNYNELQTHISRKETLSDSQIVQMRLQVQQQRLKVEEESRKQHQYHSQRQPRSDHSDSQLRPVSNFYEYESIQTILNSQAGRKHNNNNNMAVHVVHPSQSQMMVHEMNGNLYQRHHQQQQQQQQGMNMKYVNGRSFGQQHHQQSRGPFITQVTIGEHKQPNGTKV